MTHSAGRFAGICLPGGVQVGSCVSEVQAAFCTNLGGLSYPLLQGQPEETFIMPNAKGKILVTGSSGQKRTAGTITTGAIDDAVFGHKARAHWHISQRQPRVLTPLFVAVRLYVEQSQTQRRRAHDCSDTGSRRETADVSPANPSGHWVVVPFGIHS